MANTLDAKRFVDAPTPRPIRNMPPPVRGPKFYGHAPWFKTRVFGACLAIFAVSEAIHYTDKTPIGNGMLEVPAKIGGLVAQQLGVRSEEVCVESSYTENMRVPSTPIPESPNSNIGGQKITTITVTIGNIYKYCTDSNRVWRNGNTINVGITLVPDTAKIARITKANTALGGEIYPSPANPSQMSQLLSPDEGAKDQARTQLDIKAKSELLGNSMVSGSDVAQAATLTLMDYIPGVSNASVPNASPDEYGWAVVTFPQPPIATKP